MLQGTRLATTTFGRRPTWNPQGLQVVYELDGLLLRTFPPDIGVPTAPDTLDAAAGYNQWPVWGPWGSRHLAYFNGPDELNPVQVMMQTVTSNRQVAAYTQLFDPRGMAWSPALPQLLVSHNLPGNPQMLLLSNLPIPTGQGPGSPGARGFTRR